MMTFFLYISRIPSSLSLTKAKQGDYICTWASLPERDPRTDRHMTDASQNVRCTMGQCSEVLVIKPTRDRMDSVLSGRSFSFKSYRQIFYQSSLAPNLTQTALLLITCFSPAQTQGDGQHYSFLPILTFHYSPCRSLH